MLVIILMVVEEVRVRVMCILCRLGVCRYVFFFGIGEGGMLIVWGDRPSPGTRRVPSGSRTSGLLRLVCATRVCARGPLKGLGDADGSGGYRGVRGGEAEGDVWMWIAIRSRIVYLEISHALQPFCSGGSPSDG